MKTQLKHATSFLRVPVFFLSPQRPKKKKKKKFTTLPRNLISVIFQRIQFLVGHNTLLNTHNDIKEIVTYYLIATNDIYKIDVLLLEPWFSLIS